MYKSKKRKSFSNILDKPGAPTFKNVTTKLYILDHSWVSLYGYFIILTKGNVAGNAKVNFQKQPPEVFCKKTCS